MTGGASKSHPSSQLTQMFSMRKTDILEDHLFLQVFSSVTPLLQTIPIIHLIMEVFDPLSYHEVSQCQLEIHPFPFEMIHEARTAMTVEAGYLIMRGDIPGLNIFLHIVAKATK
jgi:hypothetical protein